MNTKEAIEKLNQGSKAFETDSILGIKISDIIEVLEDYETLGQIKITPKDFYNRVEYVNKLKCGEKYKAIIEEIKQYCLILENQNVLKEIIRLELKYFPKGGSQ